MPRFHFHVHDGRSRPDREGTDLRDWTVARAEAIRHAGLIIRDEGQRLASGDDWHMEVTDERGLVLFRLDFAISDSSTIRQIRIDDEDRE